MPRDVPASAVSSTMEMAQSNQDLILNKKRRKLRTYLVTGIGIGAVVLVLIIITVWLANFERTGTKGSGRQQRLTSIALEDILKGKTNPQSFNASWATGSELLYINSNGALVLRNIDQHNPGSKLLLNANHPLLTYAFEFKLSSDKKYLAIARFYQKVYRYSYKSRYAIVNLESYDWFNLTVGGNASTSSEPFFIDLFEWSPQGNACAFVYENNLYYISSVESGATNVSRLTYDNATISNGIPDWVNEEEVFSSNSALWFSPDGKKLAFGRFDDTHTPLMVIPIYGEPGNFAFQYPRGKFLRYPKVGAPNPVVSLHCANLDTHAVNKLTSPSYLREPLLTAVAWANNEIVVAIWMNRVQNRAAIIAYENPHEESTQASRVLTNITQQHGWLNLFEAPVFSANGSSMAFILSRKQENQDSFRHIVRLNLQGDKPIEDVTKGEFVVTDILGWHQKHNKIYYLATGVHQPQTQYLYRVHADNGLPEQIGIIDGNENCTYQIAEFSPDLSHYLLNCGGPGVPTLTLYQTVQNDAILPWELNEKLTNMTKFKNLPTLQTLSVPIADGFEAVVRLKLPQDIDTSGATKYPMVVDVYAGPDSFQVVDKFNVDWGSYLATNKNIIYAAIDGRGSGLKGDRMLFATYRNLGSVEIVDQINVTRYLHQHVPYIDPTRTAIFGWSYGGYAAGLALATDTEDVFKCGISVAPVTDWIFYDSIYTERFMGMPTIDDNLRGYKDSSLLPKAEGLRDKMYFLIHGTYDDNVHYQQSMMWAKVLEANDILFRQLTYPDQDHALSAVRPHLYHSLEKFLDECFVVDEQ